ncbi:MAG: phosphoribosyltransferase family protein [Arcicella sp.]|nr:phosphoribosyltransferase family protein [Arcicella sp.]
MTILESFIDLIFPRICAGCEQPLQLNEELLCTNCRFDLPKTNSHIGVDRRLVNKFAGKVKIEHSLAYLKFVKGGKVQKIMHEIKYKGNQDLGEMLGRMYGSELREKGFHEQFDLILPVPLHKKRLIVRGYNQSDCLAKGLAESLNIEWRNDVLKRGIETESQIAKSRLERYENMHEVFYVENFEGLKDKRIVIIDDTLTTGSTLESCVLALNDTGIKNVSIIAMATAE